MHANRTRRPERPEATTRSAERATAPRPARGAPTCPGRRPPTGRRAGGRGHLRGDAELDHRKAAILNAVVSEYIETAQPVGSAHITGNPGVEVSSATVRSEMAALERDGYLAQPHTSAGRIPTDKGYRFFVDHLGRPGHPRARTAPGGPQVLRPRPRRSRGASRPDERPPGRAHRLRGGGRRAHPRVGHHPVGPTGRALGATWPSWSWSSPTGPWRSAPWSSPPTPPTTVLADAAAHLTAHTARSDPGRPGDDSRAAGPGASTWPSRAAASHALGELAAAGEPDHVFVGGSSRMASAFDAVETVRSVLSILEQQLVVVELIEHILDRGLSVAIGAEHGFEPLASCALVVAPVAVDG